jgi:hypothetical protein
VAQNIFSGSGSAAVDQNAQRLRFAGAMPLLTIELGDPYQGIEKNMDRPSLKGNASPHPSE